MASIHLQTEIPEEQQNKRLDQALAALFPDYSRAQLQRWIEAGFVQVDNQVCLTVRNKVHQGAIVEINAAVTDQTHWQPQALDLAVIYEDESLIIINKPVGMVVHPAAGNAEGTLVNALLHYYPELAEIPRAGLIHRLDKDTTGLLVVARTLSAQHYLVQQLQQRLIQREYFCIVHGQLISGGTINAPMGRHPRQRTKRAILVNGKPAITHYRIQKKLQHFTGLLVTLETGRTHQIRVHLQHIGYPILGDPVYGGRKYLPAGASPELIQTLKGWQRQALHAQRLKLQHPVTGEWCEWIAPLPEDLRHLWELLIQQDQ